MLVLPVMWQLGDEDCILPSKLQAALQQILEEREDILNHVDGDESEGVWITQSILSGSAVSAKFTCMHFIENVPPLGQQADLSSLVSEGFVRFFVELVGHYPLHMVESSNGSRELQRDSFRKSHPSRGVRQFLQLFMDSQMFAGFIQDKELCKGGGRGKWCNRLSLKPFFMPSQNQVLKRPMWVFRCRFGIPPPIWTYLKYEKVCESHMCENKPRVIQSHPSSHMTQLRWVTPCPDLQIWKPRLSE